MTYWNQVKTRDPQDTMDATAPTDTTATVDITAITAIRRRGTRPYTRISELTIQGFSLC